MLLRSLIIEIDHSLRKDFFYNTLTFGIIIHIASETKGKNIIKVLVLLLNKNNDKTLLVLTLFTLRQLLLRFQMKLLPLLNA
jgi:hypothetical protein